MLELSLEKELKLKLQEVARLKLIEQNKEFARKMLLRIQSQMTAQVLRVTTGKVVK